MLVYYVADTTGPYHRLTVDLILSYHIILNILYSLSLR